MKPLERKKKGFLLTNGSGCYIVDKEVKNEIDDHLANGWKIAVIRPICVSTDVKLFSLPPEIIRQGVFSYSLCILEPKDSF